MASFKKTVSINGAFKLLAVEDGTFINVESGEVVPVGQIIENALGSGQPFDLKVTTKTDEEITPDEE